MSLIRKALALLFLCPLVVVPCAQAQHGKVTPHTSSSTTTRGIHSNAEPTLAEQHIYVFGVGLGNGLNTPPTNLIDCSLVGNPSYPNVQQPTGATCPSSGPSEAYVVADSSGYFDLTGTFYQDCTSDTQGVYLESTGGTVGGTMNNQLTLLAVPPSTYDCVYLYENSSTIFLNITDFTNVVAALAVGSFANTTFTTPPYGTDNYDGISVNTVGTDDQAAQSEYALQVAYDAANNVVPISTGVYGGTNTDVEYQLNTIADVIASCIDSAGGTSSPSPCYSLFEYTQGPFTYSFLPTDTWQAVESMAQNPTSYVSDQWELISSTPPWSPWYDSAAPSTWALIQSLTTTPVLYPLTTSYGGGGDLIHIQGTHLVDETTSPATYPIVVLCGASAVVDQSASGSTDLYVTVPSLPYRDTSPSNCVIEVYLEGDFSNMIPFTVNPPPHY